MGKRILLPQDIDEEGKRWLLERGYELKLGNGITAEILAEDVKGCDAIIARLGDFNETVLECEPKLRVIARHGAGYDNIDTNAAKRLGIWVSNDPVSNINAVAEHVMALLLGCAKNLVYLDHETRRGNFHRRNECLTMELAGKTLGVAGFGRIGQLVAKKARDGLGMKILAYDPFVSDCGAASDWEMTDSLESLLNRADFVTIHMPLGEETKHIMGEAQFHSMKPSAFFVNAARGELMDEAALITALESGLIAGAALDVFEKEPPVCANPLLSMEQVIVSPHNAALTKDAMEAMALTAARAVDDVLEGRRPEYCVIEGTR